MKEIRLYSRSVPSAAKSGHASSLELTKEAPSVDNEFQLHLYNICESCERRKIYVYVFAAITIPIMIIAGLSSFVVFIIATSIALIGSLLLARMLPVNILLRKTVEKRRAEYANWPKQARPKITALTEEARQLPTARPAPEESNVFTQLELSYSSNERLREDFKARKEEKELYGAGVLFYEDLREELKVLKEARQVFSVLLAQFPRRADIVGFGGPKGAEVIRIICKVCDDTARAITRGRDVNNEPIEKWQISRGLSQLVSDARQDIGVVAIVLNPTGVELYKEYLDVLEKVAGKIK
jgi:hypothetical protein